MHALRAFLGMLCAVTLLTAGCAAAGAADAEAPAASGESPAAANLNLDAPLVTCDALPEAWQMGFAVLPEPELAEPERGRPFTDAVFGTCVMRVSDRAQDLAPGDGSLGIKNEYARVQSFNSDGRYLVLRGTDATWYLYEGASLRPAGQLPLGTDPRWDAVDPLRLYYFEETRLMAYRIDSGEATLVHEFAEDFPGRSLAAVWWRYEGSPSLDGRTWGLMAEDENFITTHLLVYDLETDAVVASRPFSPLPDTDVDSVSISPSGEYFLVFMENVCEQGRLGSPEAPCGVLVFDRGLAAGRGVLRSASHGDLTFDAAGREVWVYQDNDTDYLSMLDLASGEITPLWPIDFSHSSLGIHISGRALAAPGWALVSVFDGQPGSSTWMDDQVFAMELKPDGRIVRLAQHHSVVDENQEHDYWAEPHASVNADFTRVLFTSNWGRSGTGEIDTYMIFLPEGWLTALP
ncbi:MAG: hypothetical protein HYZ26_09835 [Chloroflexi bacterium]|nr:hypothetical protein [Chloroflexota bacterium]